MKATLHFDLDDPQDREDFSLQLKTNDLVAVLREIAERFRQTQKYDAKPITREEFIGLLREYDLGDI